MKEISAEIEINTPAEKVWQILTDFAHFPDWNPFIREIIASVVEGSRLEIHISTSSGKNRTYKPTLTKIEPNHELRWYGKGLLPGLLNGERIFTIEQLAQNHVRMLHREIFTGLGAFFTGDRMNKDPILFSSNTDHESKSYLLLSFDVGSDAKSIIENKVMPYIESKKEIFT